MKRVLTTHKQGHRSQGAMFRLKALQQRRKRQNIQQNMPETRVNKGVRIESVHC
jgi:hypothetical protein